MSDANTRSEGRASARLVKGESHVPDQTCGSMSLRPSVYRQRPIHLAPTEQHNRAVIVFVTVCTYGRRKILASPLMHEAIVSAWKDATAWLVGRYVIMPDHVHLFCGPSGIDSPSLERWMRYWKSIVTRKLDESGGTLWQRGHWDRQLRTGEGYGEKWQYVRNNAVRHNLVTTADQWPYQGKLNELRW